MNGTLPKISLGEHALIGVVAPIDPRGIEWRDIEAAKAFFRDLKPGENWTLKLAKLLSETYNAGYTECLREPIWENPEDA